MGSSGSKKTRRGGHRQHLEKVGTQSHSAAAHEQQLERQAVLDSMGLGGVGGVGRAIVWTVVVLFFIAAIVALLVLIVF